MMKTAIKTIRLKSRLSNDIWCCDDYSKIKYIDGVEFIEVYKEFSPRKFWINKQSLEKIKK